MTHGGRDPASVLACFDQFGAVVFGSLCHLAAGDAAAAQRLLIQTFAHGLPAKSSAYESSGGALDRRAVVVAAPHCYLQDPHAAGTGSGPVAALTPTERAVLNLEVIERMRSPEINFAVRMAENDADYVAEAALRRLNSEAYGRSPADVLAACEVWFDDAMRAQCRTEIEQALAFAPPPTDAEGIAVQDSRSRRLTIGASVAASIIVAIALGAWLAPSNERSATDVAGLAPTTIASTATTSGVSRRDPSELADPTTTTDTSESRDSTPATGNEPGFILNPPPQGFVVNSAKSASAARPATGWLEVWSTPGATRTEGRWFAVRTGGETNPVLQNATRETVDGNMTLTTVDAMGVTLVVEQLDDGTTVEFEMFGFARGDIRQLILAIAVGDDGTVERTPRLESVTRGMEVMWSGPTYGSGGPPVLTADRQHAYYRSTDASRHIEVVTAPQVANDLAVSRLLTRPPSPDTFDTERMIVLSDVDALVGKISTPLLVGQPGSQPDMVFAQWHSGTHTVTVMARLPIEELIQIARSAHLASSAQWATLGDSVSLGIPRLALTDFGATSIGANATDSQQNWNIVAIDVGCPAVTFLEQTSQIATSGIPEMYGGEVAFCVTPDPAQPLIEFASFDATFLIVLFADAPSATRLRVDAGGGPASAPIIRSERPPLYAAAFAFSQEGLYLASLTDDAGVPLQDLQPVPAPESP